MKYVAIELRRVCKQCQLHKARIKFGTSVTGKRVARCTACVRATSTNGLNPLYGVWSSMKNRCQNPKNQAFALYGGRGIEVCTSWAESFQAFARWALANGWKPDLQLDRIDNNGSYEPNNCRFVTPTENSRNRRSNRQLTAFGETKYIFDWLEDPRCVVKRTTLNMRLRKYGWSVEQALTQLPGGTHA